MRLVDCVFFSVLIIASNADEDWRPIRRDPRLVIESANQGLDGIYYEPAESTSSKNIAGFSSGSGLRSFAQTSADKAQEAVFHQNIVADQAAFIAQRALAQSAKEAAETAKAALASKKALLDSLREERDRANNVLQAEMAQLEIAKKSAANAETSAQHSKNHASVLVAALNSAKMVAEQAKRSNSEAAAELAAQTAVIGKTKSTLKATQDKLETTRYDYEATKEAAEKAMEVAHEAQRNAQRAGNEVSVKILQMAAGQSSHVKRSALKDKDDASSEQGNEEEL